MTQPGCQTIVCDITTQPLCQKSLVLACTYIMDKSICLSVKTSVCDIITQPGCQSSICDITTQLVCQSSICDIFTIHKITQVCTYLCFILVDTCFSRIS